MISCCGNCKFMSKRRARRDGSTVPDALLPKEVRCIKFNMWLSENDICVDYEGNTEKLKLLLKIPF